MQVLLSGSFGNIGKRVLKLLLETGYRVRCFDIETERNRKAFESFSRSPRNGRVLEVSWGDIRDRTSVLKATEDVQGIIHLAAVIPPLSEENLDTGRAINVEGTRNLIRAAEELDPPPKFIFTSSVSVYGPRMSDPPPRTTDDPVNPTDHYSSHKVACEGMLRESSLPWTVLRVAAVSVSDVNGSMDPIIFEIPLDQRIEFVHSRDVARACVNSLTEDVTHRVLHVGGGNGSQMLQREFLTRILDATGLGMFPDCAFLSPEKDSDWFYTDYMDTEEAQALLHYQVYTFEDYLQEMRRKLGAKRTVARFLGPALRLYFSTQSPYFRDYWKKRLSREGKR